MYRPPLDPRDRPTASEPTWESIAVSYMMVVATPLLFWTLSHPVTGGLGLGAVAATAVVARRASRLARCYSACRGIAFEVGRGVHVTVTWAPADEAT